MPRNTHAMFDAISSVVLTRDSEFEKHEYEVVWHGGMKSPLGGHTKGELLGPYASREHPTFVSGNGARDEAGRITPAHIQREAA